MFGCIVKVGYKHEECKIHVKILIILLCFIPFSVTAWGGYDYTEGSYVEIDKGNLVRPGEEIEVYDYNAGEYRTFEME